jgi:hypothetical protein
MNGKKSFNINIKNVSVSGFLAEIRDKNIQDYVLASKIAYRTNTSMRAELISFEETNFRFQWIKGNEKDRVAWLREISSFSGDEVDANNFNEDEILSLFCQSESFSLDFMKKQKDLPIHIKEGIEQSASDSAWTFKLTNKDSQSRKNKAFVNAIKCGNNSWTLVDLVSDRYQNKMSEDFFPNFAIAMMELSLTLQPCPRHFVAWVADHPYYILFEKFLSDHAHLCIQKSKMYYTRITTEILLKESEVNTLRINSDDFTKIEDQRECLRKNNLLHFVDMMDFSINDFESHYLESQVQADEQIFKREYWNLEFENISYLSILTYLPEGINPGRFIDSIYLFSLTDDTHISLNTWKKIKNAVIYLAASRGFSTHAIRRISNNDKKWEDEVAVLNTFALHPKAWSFFKK